MRESSRIGRLKGEGCEKNLSKHFEIFQIAEWFGLDESAARSLFIMARAFGPFEEINISSEFLDFLQANLPTPSRHLRVAIRSSSCRDTPLTINAG